MKKIELHKAEPMLSSEIVEDIEIHISKKLPDSGKFSTLEETERIFKDDAKKLYSILSNHTPQGMRYQLLLLLLEDAKIYYIGK